MKKLLLAFAIVSMAASAYAGEGKEKGEGKKSEAEKREEGKRNAEAGTSGRSADVKAAQKSAVEFVSSVRSVSGAGAEAAERGLQGYIANGTISKARVDELSKDSSEDARNYSELLVRTTAAGEGEGIAKFGQAEMGSNAKWSQKAKDKRSIALAEANKAYAAGNIKAGEALRIGLEKAGFDLETIKKICKECFGIIL